MRTLLLGAARSGKSALAVRWAQERASDAGLPVCLIATARASDAEMRARIDSHRRNRPAGWQVLEEPLHLGRALHRSGSSLVLVDCLTLWLANCLWPTAEGAADLQGWQHERAEFLAALAACHGPAIFVTNEVGSGIVPDNAVSRLFRDQQGWLNQQVAAICEEVFLVSAGLTLALKSAVSRA
jgi:adenosylcobinamide kinase / adenosylcobinamide-phosphate guanylyltransferase